MRLCAVCNKIVSPHDCGRTGCPMGASGGGSQALDPKAAGRQPVRSLLPGTPETSVPENRAAPPPDWTPRQLEPEASVAQEVPASPKAEPTYADNPQLPDEPEARSARPAIIGLAAISLVAVTGWASWHFLSGPDAAEPPEIGEYHSEEPSAEYTPPAAFQPPIEEPAAPVPTVFGTFQASAADQVISLDFYGTVPVPAHTATGVIDYVNSVTGASCSAKLVARPDSLSMPNSPVTYDQVPMRGLPACPTPFRLELQPAPGSITDYGQVGSMTARWVDGNTGQLIMSTTLVSTSELAD